MQELGKFNLKINVIPNGLEKHMSFIVNNKLSFVDSFQFLSSSSDSFVKNLIKDDFKYLSQKFNNNVLENNDKDGKALYKSMNNAIYRKTMLNLRNRIRVELVNNEEDFKMYIKTKPHFAQNI